MGPQVDRISDSLQPAQRDSTWYGTVVQADGSIDVVISGQTYRDVPSVAQFANLGVGDQVIGIYRDPAAFREPVILDGDKRQFRVTPDTPGMVLGTPLEIYRSDQANNERTGFNVGAGQRPVDGVVDESYRSDVAISRALTRDGRYSVGAPMGMGIGRTNLGPPYNDPEDPSDVTTCVWVYCPEHRDQSDFVTINTCYCFVEETGEMVWKAEISSSEPESFTPAYNSMWIDMAGIEGDDDLGSTILLTVLESDPFSIGFPTVPKSFLLRANNGSLLGSPPIQNGITPYGPSVIRPYEENDGSGVKIRARNHAAYHPVGLADMLRLVPLPGPKSRRFPNIDCMMPVPGGGDNNGVADIPSYDSSRDILVAWAQTQDGTSTVYGFKIRENLDKFINKKEVPSTIDIDSIWSTRIGDPSRSNSISSRPSSIDSFNGRIIVPYFSVISGTTSSQYRYSIIDITNGEVLNDLRLSGVDVFSSFNTFFSVICHSVHGFIAPGLVSGGPGISFRQHGFLQRLGPVGSVRSSTSLAGATRQTASQVTYQGVGGGSNFLLGGSEYSLSGEVSFAGGIIISNGKYERIAESTGNARPGEFGFIDPIPVTHGPAYLGGRACIDQKLYCGIVEGSECYLGRII